MSPFSGCSSRWNPTAEQVMILEEMYRTGGVRTPNAPQIQQITAHLSRYGKIQGKNVFYWFQNHKARDRQRLRRKLNKMQLYHNIMVHQHNHNHDHNRYCLDHTTTQLSQDSYSWKLNQIPELECRSGDNHMITKPCGCDWTKIFDVGPPRKPLETLDLFPITSTGGLK